MQQEAVGIEGASAEARGEDRETSADASAEAPEQCICALPDVPTRIDARLRKMIEAEREHVTLSESRDSQ